MTTIAYKDNVIAYDSRTSGTDHIITDRTDKRYRYKGYNFFLCGTTCDMDALMEALVDGKEHKDVPVSGFMLDPQGVLWAVGGQDEPWKVRQQRDIPAAFGSGTHFALAAMDFGRSAKDAVKYAKTRDSNTGGKVRTFRLTK